MFTGIIEQIGQITAIHTQGTNVTFTVQSFFDSPIKVDQSIAHNGVCLTVTDIFSITDNTYEYAVTAVKETLEKTHLGDWKVGTFVNIERCMRVGDRLDGHFVQGHVDTKGRVEEIQEVGGSWMYVFSFDPKFSHLLVDKGSITINGVSLTVVASEIGRFSVTIIPFTYAHTTFQSLAVGEYINLEFDILGKYMDKIHWVNQQK